MIFFRRLPRFEYVSPGTLEEVLGLLEEHKGKARVMAGGTDLLVQMKNRETAPEYLISLKNISGLDYINYHESDGLRLGALATIESVEKSPVVRDKYGVLARQLTVWPQPRSGM